MISSYPDSPQADASTKPGGGRGHIPQRMCCICRTRMPKYNLQRYVCRRDDHGRLTLKFDPQQNLPGRGFYLCSDPGCQRALTRHKGWQKKCRGES
jgi:hypothetical protein